MPMQIQLSLHVVVSLTTLKHWSFVSSPAWLLLLWLSGLCKPFAGRHMRCTVILLSSTWLCPCRVLPYEPALAPYRAIRQGPDPVKQ